MNTRVDDDDLRRLEADPTFTAGLDQGLVKAFRSRMGSIRMAPDERDFYKMKSWHFEKLSGNRQHQHSMRLNGQFRLIIEFEGAGAQKVLVVKGIEDYH